jgi:hypothetical protein
MEELALELQQQVEEAEARAQLAADDAAKARGRAGRLEARLEAFGLGAGEDRMPASAEQLLSRTMARVRSVFVVCGVFKIGCMQGGAREGLVRRQLPAIN